MTFCRLSGILKICLKLYLSVTALVKLIIKLLQYAEAFCMMLYNYIYMLIVIGKTCTKFNAHVQIATSAAVFHLFYFNRFKGYSLPTRFNEHVPYTFHTRVHKQGITSM